MTHLSRSRLLESSSALRSKVFAAALGEKDEYKQQRILTVLTMLVSAWSFPCRGDLLVACASWSRGRPRHIRQQ